MSIFSGNTEFRYAYYQEDDFWVGWLEDYPNCRSQGKTLDELKENLRDIYADLNAGEIVV